MRKVGEVAQLRRDRAGELVVVEVEPARKVGEVAQLRRDRAGEFIVAEVEMRVRSVRLPSSGGIGPASSLLWR